MVRTGYEVSFEFGKREISVCARACLCLFSAWLFVVPPLYAEGMRKDRGRVMRRDKRRTGTSDRVRSFRDLERRTVPPQDRRKHSSSSSITGGGQSAVIGIPPDQVWNKILLLTIAGQTVMGGIYGFAPIIDLLNVMHS